MTRYWCLSCIFTATILIPDSSSMNSLLVLIQSLSLIILINFQLSLCADVVEHANCSQPITCGYAETNIVYPFWGANRPEYCGKSGFEVTCQSNIPIISMKSVDFRILEFTNETTGNQSVIRVARNDYWGTICPDNYVSTNLDLALFSYTAGFQNISFFYNCNSTATSTSLVGSSPTSSEVCNANVSVSYLTETEVAKLAVNPVTGGFCAYQVLVPVSDAAVTALGTNQTTIQTAIDGGFELDAVNSDANLCSSCEASGGACGVNSTSSQFRCFCEQTSNSRTTCTSSNSSSSSGGNKQSLIIAAVSATAELIVLIVSYILWKKTMGNERKRKRYGTLTKLYNIGGRSDAELTLFSIKSIIAATNNFSEANKLGEGGFGPVYKGILTEHQEVAMKRLSKKSGQGHQEFMNELKLIAKLQHTNLVKLLGCCIEDEEMILIYEYLPNRSLDKFLFDPSENRKLDWGKRFQIIEGIAQGVVYIHKHSRLKIIHRDIKASNVLLDEEMNPKISDFGMAKIFEVNQIEANTNRVVGTYGYMSPEYARYGHFSEKLDVFSFGVLLLEIVSGKRNGAFYHFEHSPTLAGWAWKLWKEGRGMEVIDESLRETCRSHEALRCIHVAFLCVQESPADRPTMSAVIHMLQASESTSLPSSKEPAFSTHSNPNAVASSSISTIHSNNECTISIPVGR